MSQLPLVLDNGALAGRALPFVEAGALAAVDLQVVDLLAARVGVSDAEVLLGLAFAVRATRVGHVGVDLARLPTSLAVQPQGADRLPAAPLPWPADPAAWAAAVRACEALVQPPQAHRSPFVAHGGLVLPRRYWRYQRRLQQALLARAQQPEPGVGRDKLGRPLGAVDCGLLCAGLDRLFPGTAHQGDRQRLGASMAVLRPLSVLSGGPGTGKTWTVKKVLALLREQWQAAGGGDPTVALAAPTGKAAVRMLQAIAEGLDEIDLDLDTREWLRGLQACTLHRLLGYNPAQPTRFRHGVDQPLPQQVVVVDEASMVDLALMCKLVEAVDPGARLVLLGDPHQLASVEAGTVLADITSGTGPQGVRVSPRLAARLQAIDGPEALGELPVEPAAPAIADGIMHFVKPYRTQAGSGLQQVAYAIAGGQHARAVAWLGGEPVGGVAPFSDLALLPHDAEGRLSTRASALLVGSYAATLELLLAGPAPSQTLPEHHAAALRHFERFRVLTPHRRGQLGVAGLNRAITAALAEQLAGRMDPSGSWWIGRPVLVSRNSYDTGRMNGDVGLVVPGLGEQGPRVVFPGSTPGSVEYLAASRMPPCETVFAMTIHKSQGSQFEHCAIVLPAQRTPLLSRELVYTALTRASARVTVVGDLRVLAQALEHPVERASTLGPLLWEAPE